MGKGFDGWAPWGPGIVTKEALLQQGGGGDGEGARKDVDGKDGKGGLRISTRLNGQTVQDSGTGDTIFGVRETVAFLSRGTTLLPGDLIFTGT